MDKVVWVYDSNFEVYSVVEKFNCGGNEILVEKDGYLRLESRSKIFPTKQEACNAALVALFDKISVLNKKSTNLLKMASVPQDTILPDLKVD